MIDKALSHKFCILDRMYISLFLYQSMNYKELLHKSYIHDMYYNQNYPTILEHMVRLMEVDLLLEVDFLLIILES
jgi:hypothetical protein